MKVKGIKSKLYSSFENKIISLDSNLEKEFYSWAIKNQFVVSLRRNTSIKIPYTYEGVSHNYVPDWIIVFSNRSVALVEIKPKVLLNDPIVIVKRDAAIRYCKLRKMQYHIVTEDFNNPIIYG